MAAGEVTAARPSPASPTRVIRSASGVGGVRIAYEVLVGRPSPAAAAAAAASAAGWGDEGVHAGAGGGGTPRPPPRTAGVGTRPFPAAAKGSAGGDGEPSPLGVVVLLAGMCVPRSMWSSAAAALAAAGWTAILIDNRGAGASAGVPASPWSAPGYSVATLASDMWAAVDDAAAAVPGAFPVANPHPVLVGHSMGGMVALRATLQRPGRVTGLALISTHAGGVINRVPSTGVLRAAARLLAAGFDPAVAAGVNLDLHFTPGYLAQRLGGGVRRGVAAAEAAVGRAVGAAEAAFGGGAGTHAASHGGGDGRGGLGPEGGDDAGSSGGGRAGGGGDDGDAGSGVPDGSADSGGGDSGNGLGRSSAAATAVTAAGILRRDAYFARYTANDEGATEKADSSTFWGHLATVASHQLTADELAELRSPARPVAVVYGAADVVVPPSSSRALAVAVAADRVVEVSGAHFVVDENEAAVVDVMLDILRRAAAIHRRGVRQRGLLDLW